MTNIIPQILLSILALAPAFALTPVNTTPDTKLCFGETHARCFELHGMEYVQTIRDSVAGPVKLTPQERARVFLAIRDYKGWAQKTLAKQTSKSPACAEQTVFTTADREEKVCISNINQKLADSKTRDLLKVLESPKIASAKSASAQKPVPASDVKGK